MAQKWTDTNALDRYEHDVLTTTPRTPYSARLALSLAIAMASLGAAFLALVGLFGITWGLVFAVVALMGFATLVVLSLCRIAADCDDAEGTR